MTPTTLHFGAFSPTGGTRRVMRALITGTPREGFAIRDFEFTLPEERRMRRFTEEDAVVLCAPVYYGRIPTPLQTKLPFEGNGARALAVVSYGNRAYEDALREWRDVLERHGFKVVGGAAFIAQHSNIPTLAAGRPDERDRGSAAECMKTFLAKLASDDDARPTLPGGDGPYRPYGALTPAPRIVDPGRCHLCGNCADNCPMGIIDPLDFVVTDPELCIACRACIKSCPDGARNFPPEVVEKMAPLLARIEEANAARKSPEWFF